jgi:hypothetical protein
VPSLFYLFRLVLTGRFDPAAPLRQGASAPLPTPASATSQVDASIRPAALAAAVLVLGAAVTFVSSGGAWLALGLAAMLGGSVALFLALPSLDDA